jgi:hypothetical protein
LMIRTAARPKNGRPPQNPLLARQDGLVAAVRRGGRAFFMLVRQFSLGIRERTAILHAILEHQHDAVDFDFRHGGIESK